MKLYAKFLAMHLKVQLQNRMSFVLMTLGQAVMAFTGIAAVLILMNNNTEILGFSRAEVLVCGSVVMMAFSLAECFGRGFDIFPRLLGNGQFDRMLVRPCNILFQVFASTVDITRFGRVAVSLVVLIFAIQSVTITSYLLLLSMIASGMIVFICLFIIYGALSFFTTESLEFMNILTDGGREFGKVPFSFYGQHVLRFLTYVVPLACFQYYPSLFLLGKTTTIGYALYPLLSLIFMIPTYFIWIMGRRHYRSTGS
ncbi:hypothetical protein G7062_04405 [Erysipelothrix sp. HDW6C]|nr:hypothetical protein G7062_04405 [Erysipelothrix sp. HDW6C]